MYIHTYIHIQNLNTYMYICIRVTVLDCSLCHVRVAAVTCSIIIIITRLYSTITSIYTLTTNLTLTLQYTYTHSYTVTDLPYMYMHSQVVHIYNTYIAIYVYVHLQKDTMVSHLLDQMLLELNQCRLLSLWPSGISQNICPLNCKYYMSMSLLQTNILEAHSIVDHMVVQL